jgi:antitoxin (DNA-binding transcriptional repressor) of toxin-antitoxin stability system
MERRPPPCYGLGADRPAPLPHPSGERVEITRNGRLVAVLTPPDRERRVLEDLIRTGAVDPGNAADACGLGDWQPLPPRPGTPSRLSEVLLQMREEEDR